MSLKKIGQTMVLFRYEYGNAVAVMGVLDAVPHVEGFGDGLEGGGDLVSGNARSIQLELRAHEEVSGLAVGMMVRVEDVSAEIMDEASHARDDAFAVPAVDEEDERFWLLDHKAILLEE